jgi:hypothetical protein
VGIFAAIAGGCSMPVMIILFGQLANSFVSQERTRFHRNRNGNVLSLKDNSTRFFHSIFPITGPNICRALH